MWGEKKSPAEMDAQTLVGVAKSLAREQDFEARELKKKPRRSRSKTIMRKE